MNILHEKRKTLPHGNPQEPISMFIASAATSLGASAAVASAIGTAAVTGMVVGGVGAAVTGGNILKGALFGAIMGGITSGVSAAFGGAGAAAGASAATVPTEAALSGSGAGLDSFLAGTANVPTEAMMAGNGAALEAQLAGSAISPVSVGEGMLATPTAAAAQTAIAPAAASPYQLVGDGINTTGSGTGFVGGTAQTGLTTSLTNTGLGAAPIGGLLSQITGGKMGSTALLVGGQMLSGAMQQKAADKETARRQANMTWVSTPQRGNYA